MNTEITAADLENCAREPIHIPAAIQPHGALLVLDEARRIVQMSANATEFLGLPAAELLGQPLSVLAPDADGILGEALAAPVLRSPLRLEIAGNSFDASVKKTAHRTLVEFERAGPLISHDHQELLRGLSELKAAPTLEAQHEVAARFISELTGFERVMMYQFDRDWHGRVVAEHLAAPVDSYMGLHFPASDIPAQARELYRKSWIRIIPHSDYQPVPVVPPLDPETQQPLDMSFVAVRSVSPIHLQYLRNMGVGASMSISLIVHGQLWGLLACHHREPRVLPVGRRAVCEIFGRVASFEIEARQEAERLSRFVRATAIQSQFFDIISEEQNVIDALTKYTPQLLDFMGANGAAIYINGRVTLLGEAPDEASVTGLIAWLKDQELTPLLETDALSELYPPAEAFRQLASGLLAVRLSRVEPQFLLWFRPEVTRTVTWAGQPTKVLDQNERLTPRTSFAAWQQTVTGHSLPWSEVERKGAEELMLAINALVLRRTERLLSLNQELERKNTDLNSFAHIASHDLREPLRGIENYLKFTKEDHGRELSTEALRKVDTMANLVAQCKELIETLNHYSHLGRLEINPRPVNVNTLLDQVLTSLELRIQTKRFEIRRPVPLPTITCDSVMTREVFSNLLTNALKYNVSEKPWIEIGCEQPIDQPVRFYVRDNGIGIRPQHFEDIFTMFRRLHARDEFEGGTGAGLAIVKTVVERHGGRIWLESTFGAGTTFWFELQPQPKSSQAT